LFLGLPEFLDDLGLLEFLEDPEILEHFQRYPEDLVRLENQNPEDLGCPECLDAPEDPEILGFPGIQNPEDLEFLAIQLVPEYLESLTPAIPEDPEFPECLADLECPETPILEDPENLATQNPEDLEFLAIQ
jgi:hypothetical protein